jgi:hypothetical protein
MPRKVAAKPVELDRSRTPIFIAAFLVVGIGITAGTIMWGSAQSGQIDVSATIANSQYGDKGSAEGDAPVISAPAQEYIEMVNGGLVPAQSTDNPAPQPEPTPSDNASSTATSTEDVTDVVEDGGTVENDEEGEMIDEASATDTESNESTDNAENIVAQ